LLAGNSSINLAGSEEQINVSQQSPTMLRMASESFIYTLLLFLGLLLKISRWVPLVICRSGNELWANKKEEQFASNYKRTEMNCHRAMQGYLFQSIPERPKH